jgi:hypothetical protein
MSKIACREFVSSHNLISFVENFGAATIHSTVPSCIANCSRFVFVPERAVREPFALKIPSVMRLAWSDFVLIHLQGVSLADKILQHQEGSAPRFRRPIVSVQVHAGDPQLVALSASDKRHLGPRVRTCSHCRRNRPSLRRCVYTVLREIPAALHASFTCGSRLSAARNVSRHGNARCGDFDERRGI